MKAVFFPFFSQQRKDCRKFSLGSDSGVRLYSYCAARAADLGWDSTLVLPDWSQCADCAPQYGTKYTVLRLPPTLPIDNMERRLHWDVGALRNVVGDADVLCTQHQSLAYPLRKLFPKLTILTECGGAGPAFGLGDLTRLAYEASDLVHCNSQELADQLTGVGWRMPTSVWTFGVEDALFDMQRLPSKHDVLFPARASATGYSNHQLFVDAMRGVAHRVLMTDPTGYLKESSGCPLEWLYEQPLSRAQYLEALLSSRVVVGLTDNGYGGYALMEAIACGSVPVALKTEAYASLLGDDWPYFCEEDASDLRRTVEGALRFGLSPLRRERLIVRLDRCRYSRAWETARKDMEGLVREKKLKAACESSGG